MRAAQRRRALDQLQAVGQEHADERARRMLRQRLDRDAVDTNVLRLPGLESDTQLVQPARTLDLDLNPSSLPAEAHDLALVARATRPPGAAEVQRLEEVGLARAVAPMDHGDAGAEGHVRAC